MTGAFMFFAILALVLVVGLALAALAFGLSHLLFRLFGKMNGLDRLAALYPASHPPEGRVYRKQWVAVGQVNYANTADVAVSSQGLYLWVRPFLGQYEPALVPWGELRDPRPAILSLQRAVRMTVGDPPVATIVLTRRLFETIRQYLA